jgi:hypothetical protein
LPKISRIIGDAHLLDMTPGGIFVIPYKVRRKSNGYFKRKLASILGYRFGICRNVLVGLGLVKRAKFKWSDELINSDIKTMFKVFSNPMLLLQHFVTAMPIDPRYRVDRISPQKRLAWSQPTA